MGNHFIHDIIVGQDDFVEVFKETQNTPQLPQTRTVFVMTLLTSKGSTEFEVPFIHTLLYNTISAAAFSK